jgi:hypothetical protein
MSRQRSKSSAILASASLRLVSRAPGPAPDAACSCAIIGPSSKSRVSPGEGCGSSRGIPVAACLAHRDGGFYDAQTVAAIHPGDELLVLPRVHTKSRQFWKDIAQILFHIAVSAKVIFGL